MRESLVPTAVGVTVFIVWASAAAHTPDPGEEAEIVRAIVATCPGQRVLAERASADFHNKARRSAALNEYEQLSRCAESVVIVHIRIGFMKLEAGDFVAAEAHSRRAVALEPSITNKLSLLEALIREKKPEADALYAELVRYDGDRDDIWTGLAYAAFHRDDVALMRKASARAIALDTRWWQAWFTAAVAEGLTERPDYAQALRWLDKAQALGAPVSYTKNMRDALNGAYKKTH
jgi:tetratricopeptide (TPR) repeat protein